MLLVLAAVSLSFGRVARADGPSELSAPAHALVPPRALHAPTVPYPPRGTGEASVVVEVVVDVDGVVSQVRLVTGAGVFAEATLEAAWTWRFEPARREGEPVAARARLRVDFSPPAPVPPPPARNAVVDSEVTEVSIRGHRTDPGGMTLGGGEVRQIPGAFGDAFRAVDALPGVVPMASGLPYFFIRGAPPGNSGYVIDGIEVPLLFHAAVGPSVIHPSLVDRVDFFPGGAPAEYGRFTGGVLSARTPEPSPVPHAEALVRVFDAGALVESPFADGRGTALAAGRYSYAGAILSLTSPIKLQYADYQARATWKLGDRDQVGLFAFGSYDDFGQVVKGVTDTIINGGFHRLDLRYDHKTSKGRLRVATTFGYARSNNDNNNIQDLSAGVRATYEEQVSAAVSWRAGADLRVDAHKLLANDLANPYEATVTSLLYPPHVDVAAGTYADVSWQLTPRVELVPGIRADVFTSHRSDDPAAELAMVGPRAAAESTSALPALDPRLSARVRVGPGVHVISSVAIAHQPATYLVPVPGLSVVQPEPVLQTAVQLSQGVTVALPADITLQVTGFLHTYIDLTDLTATCPSVFGSGVLLGNAPNIMNNLCIVQHVRGEAFGGELSLRRSLTKRLTGWVSYTLSRSTREAPAPDELGAQRLVTIPASFDRPHVVSALIAYDLGAHWRAGVRFVAYSGLPYSNTRFYVPVPPFNGERMPAFYRFDVRLEKRWLLPSMHALGKLGESPTISLVFEGMNVTLNKEVLGVHCAPAGFEPPGTNDTCTYQTLGPVTVPSVGVEGVF